MILVAAVLSVFGLALIAPGLHRLLGKFTGPVLALAPGGLAVWLLTQAGAVAGGEAGSWSIPWAPSLGLALDLRLDGLSLLMLLLISGIGALILIYAGSYLSGHVRLGRFFAFLLFFMGSMLGLVASDNLIALFVFWELTSVASYLLIGFESEQAKARAAALHALLITGGGGLALLAGILLLGQIAGTFSISVLIEQSAIIQAHPLYLPVLLLVLAGAFTKSAQVPFHFWLPGAMAAPTPVSAYLHSATMVKAGVFLLARLNPVLGGTPEWHHILTVFGAITMFFGALMALPETDLKRLLAYSTVSALGTLTLLIGLGTTESLKAAAVFLLVHSLYKGALFMVAGAVDHEAGTRDVRALSGLIRVMPLTAIAAGLAALSMSGFPPLLGFIGKELLYEAKLQAPSASTLVTAAGVGANVIMVAVAIIVGIRPFHGPPPARMKHEREAPFALWFGPMFLTLAGVVLGLFPHLVGTHLIEPAVAAVRGETTEINLKLWHGVNLVLLLSVATVLGGMLLYLLRHRIRAVAERWGGLSVYGPESLFNRTLAGILRLADFQTRWLQHGYLRFYIMTVLAVSLGGVVYGLSRFGAVPLWEEGDTVEFYGVAIAIAVVVAAAMAAISSSRLTAVIALSVVGYGVGLFFIFHGAPDLAITQILVETLSLLLFVLVVWRLPHFADFSSSRRRLADGIIALAAGAVMTVLVLKAVHVNAAPPISSYFLENSLAAFGRNVVNVILVDFRALDTLGEIVVLGAAAMGVYALFKMPRPPRKGVPEE